MRRVFLCARKLLLTGLSVCARAATDHGADENCGKGEEHEEEARMRVALRLAAAAKGLEEHTEEVEDAKERANQEASRGVWYWRSSGLGC